MSRWISKYKCKAGIQKNILRMINAESSTFERESDRNAILIFDEMDIKKKYCYDSRNKKVLFPAKHLQVVIARGLSAPFKQPVYWSFNTPMDKDLLFSIIEQVEANNLKVRGIVCDLGNHKLIKDLKLYEQNFFLNPADKRRKVFFFPDSVHIMKLLRNHILDKGVLIPKQFHNDHNRKNPLKINDWSDYVKLEKKDFQELLDKDLLSELRMLFKLSYFHIDVNGQARQRTRLATQLFSHTVAKAMKHLFKNKVVQSEAIEIIDNWFDVMNSSTRVSKKKYRCALGVHEGEQIEALNKMQLLVNILMVDRPHFLVKKALKCQLCQQFPYMRN